MGSLSVMAAVALTAVTLQPTDAVVQDHVDLIEVNHYFDQHGQRVLDQIIFYDWSGRASQFLVCDWRLLKSPSQLPVRDWKHGGYVSMWHDGKTMRIVHASDVRETWTRYDPEVANRKFLPRSFRRELRRN